MGKLIFEKAPLIDWIRRSDIIVTQGHFELASGRHSETYFQKRRLTEVEGWGKLVRPLADYFWRLDALIALAGWGETLGQCVQRLINSPPHPRQLPLLITTKTEIGNHELTLEQLAAIKDQKVGVVDDVITTGHSVTSVVVSLEEVVAKYYIGALFLRGEANHLPFKDHLVSILEYGDFPDLNWKTYEPLDCPFCQAGRSISQTKI